MCPSHRGYITQRAGICHFRLLTKPNCFPVQKNKIVEKMYWNGYQIFCITIYILIFCIFCYKGKRDTKIININASKYIDYIPLNKTPSSEEHLASSFALQGSPTESSTHKRCPFSRTCLRKQEKYVKKNSYGKKFKIYWILI